MSNFKVREGVCVGSDFISRRVIRVARLLYRAGFAGLRRRGVEAFARGMTHVLLLPSKQLPAQRLTCDAGLVGV
jgi:hypothetical protein